MHALTVDEKLRKLFHPIISQFTHVGNAGKNTAINVERAVAQFAPNAALANILITIRFMRPSRLRSLMITV